jgi:taurine dioxygenase
MASIKVRPLQDNLGFGSRISGVTLDTLKDEAVRKQIFDVFEDRGMIVFEDVEPSGRMHVALSDVFGPLKPHPLPSQALADDTLPGVIEMKYDPEKSGVNEVDGRILSQWLPWHFDHCYNNELNRAGVLRATVVPPEGGLTLFADGIEMYRTFSPELRQRLEGLNILYTLDLSYDSMRFGRPKSLSYVRVPPELAGVQSHAKTLPRAVHPAIWTRKTGEKVLHVSPWGAVGIEGHEDAEGDALLEAACQEVQKTTSFYTHKWKLTDMLIWDNWRMLHAVSGMAPEHARCMHRTTIKGDYGLGYFENGGKGDALLEMTV